LIDLAKRNDHSIADPADVLDATVIRMPKAYPGRQLRPLPALIEWSKRFENLFLIMQRRTCNSRIIRCAMLAVDQIVNGGATDASVTQYRAGIPRKITGTEYSFPVFQRSPKA
jgi:hypothetical protein